MISDRHKLRIEITEMKQRRPQVPLRSTVDKSQRNTFEDKEKIQMQTSFGHHQRDKDEKGLSPSRNKKVKQQKKEEKRLKTIHKIKMKTAIKKPPGQVNCNNILLFPFG